MGSRRERINETTNRIRRVCCGHNQYAWIPYRQLIGFEEGKNK
nr:MAG TPA: Hepatoma-derived growth factor, hHDGF, HRP, HATH, PWWP [Caudoviricetes sp.]